MPIFEFSVIVNTDAKTAWETYHTFEAMGELDDNTKEITLIKKTEEGLGTIYQTKGMLNGELKTYQFTNTTFKPNEMIEWTGGNEKISAVYTILFTPISDKVTKVTYRTKAGVDGKDEITAPIEPGLLEKLTEAARVKMQQKSEAKFGAVAA